MEIKDSRDVVTLSIEENQIVPLEELAKRLNSIYNIKNNTTWNISKNNDNKKYKVHPYITKRKTRKYEQTPHEL